MRRKIREPIRRSWNVWLPGRNEHETFLGTVEADCRQSAMHIARLAYGPEAEVTQVPWSSADVSTHFVRRPLGDALCV